MAPSYLFAFVSILYCIFCSCDGVALQANKVYCVVSTSNTNLGCQGYDFIEQNTLTHYLSHSSKYFNSYETYALQDGNHTLLDSFKLKIKSVTNLTLIGPDRTQSSQKAIINCNGTATSFQFYYSLNVVISNLTFISCIQQHKPRDNHGLGTLLFLNCTKMSLLGITLLGSVDAAFFIGDGFGNITIDNVVVKNSNTAGLVLRDVDNGISFNHCHNTTTYLSITNSRFINNTNFLHKRHFLAASGLTLVVRCPNVTVKIFNLTMSNNTGYMGGNLAVFTSPKYIISSSIEIANSTFESGRAAKGAGMFLSLGGIKFLNGECKDKINSTHTNCFMSTIQAFQAM